MTSSPILPPMSVSGIKQKPHQAGVMQHHISTNAQKHYHTCIKTATALNPPFNTVQAASKAPWRVAIANIHIKTNHLLVDFIS